MFSQFFIIGIGLMWFCIGVIEQNSLHGLFGLLVAANSTHTVFELIWGNNAYKKYQ